MNLSIVLIACLLTLGLILYFMSEKRFKREQGYQITKAGYLLALVVFYIATGKVMLFYLFLISCLLDVFCTILYFEAHVKKEEDK